MEAINFFSEIKVPATIVHVLSVVIGMGSALLSDILFNFYAKDKRLNKTERTTLEILSKVVWVSLAFIVVSGIVIFLSDTDKYIASTKFMAKMTILCVLVLNGYILQLYTWKHLLRPEFFTAKREAGARKVSFVGGAVSVISWLSVCLLGVLDSLPMSYLYIVGIYVGVILMGIFVALYLEDREFEKKR